MNKKLFTALCTLDGVSGYENAVQQFILNELKTSTVPMDVTVDKMGNILVHLHGTEPANKILQIDAYSDIFHGNAVLAIGVYRFACGFPTQYVVFTLSE